MKIIHPYHPRCGETVEIQRVIRGADDPDLIIRQADGLYAAISASWTDYSGSSTPLSTANPPQLDLAGLCRMAELVRAWAVQRQDCSQGEMLNDEEVDHD